MCRKLSLFISILLLSTKTFAAELITHTGKVTQVAAFPHTYGSYDVSRRGLLTIYVEGLPKGCASGHPRVVIGLDHPIHDAVLSLALMAKATQTEVTVAYFNECTIRAESWDLAYLAIK